MDSPVWYLGLGDVASPKKCHPELVKVVASLDLGRILLETEAPFSYNQDTMGRPRPATLVWLLL